MDQKKEFVREYRRGLYKMTELAERTAISRKTGYALVRWVEEQGVAGLQPHGSRANWHTYLHLLVTDGGFRPDGNFVSLPPIDAGPREPRHGTPTTPVRRRHASRLRTPPRPPATTRGSLARAAVPPARQTGPRRVRPPSSDVPAALTGPERERGQATAQATARHAALTRSAIAPYAPRIVATPRSKFLSHLERSPNVAFGVKISVTNNAFLPDGR